MCELSGIERTTLLAHVTHLDELIASIKASAYSVEERNWMDHDELRRLLAGVADTATEAQHWVHHKAAHGS